MVQKTLVRKLLADFPFPIDTLSQSGLLKSGEEHFKVGLCCRLAQGKPPGL